jgi:hypothetical protein
MNGVAKGMSALSVESRQSIHHARDLKSGIHIPPALPPKALDKGLIRQESNHSLCRLLG